MSFSPLLIHVAFHHFADWLLHAQEIYHRLVDGDLDLLEDEHVGETVPDQFLPSVVEGCSLGDGSL